MKEFWDERYQQTAYAFGEEPNAFLAEQLPNLKVGTILFPAEGEGRNAVFAAKFGWEVSAFDISAEGKSKALKLAEKQGVALNFEIGDLEAMNYSNEQFDAIALIYAHFPANIKMQYHSAFDRFLKKGGILILEAFSKKHVDYNSKNEKVGGPRDVQVLYSIEEIQQSFPNYEIHILEEKEIELNEGLYHVGTGHVVRFVGRKI